MRYLVERRQWAEAAALAERVPPSFPWERFALPEAITQFARGLGAARTGDLSRARKAVNELAAEKNLKAWKHIGAEYRDYVKNDDTLETDEDKEDILLPLDEAILHAEEMVLTISGEGKKEGEE